MMRNKVSCAMTQFPIDTSLYLPSNSEMSLADQETIASIDFLDKSGSEATDGNVGGFGALELIKRVASGAAKVILSDLRPKKCVVLCGAGNNGADGVALAIELAKSSIEVSTVLVYAARYSAQLIQLLADLPRLDSGLKPLFCIGGNLRDIDPVVSGGDLFRYISKEELKKLLKNADLVVDCLLGTGQKGDLRGQYRETVELVNSNVGKNQIISIDLPTGINSDTGEIYQPCIRASKTIAIQCLKRGLTQYPAKEMVGAVNILDIGIKFSVKPEFTLIDEQQADAWTVRRKANSHKGDFGTVLVVAGSASMPGAASLVSLGALHSGAGLVMKAEPKMDRYPNLPPEIIIKQLSCRDEFGLEGLPSILEIVNSISSVVLGPGMGVSDKTEEFVVGLVRALEMRSIPYVIDADALNIIAKRSAKIQHNHAVLTPHPKEAARLLQSEVNKIEQDRFSAIKQLQEMYGGTVLLKGASTIAWNGRDGIVNTTGTPALATAGSGDVLAGLIGSLLAQGYPPIKAAALGAFYHGKAAIKLSKITGGAITASALAPQLASSVKI